MYWIDLSHPMRSPLATFPGSPPAKIETIATINENGYQEKRLYLNSHSGTHLDSPAHMPEDGLSIDKLPVEKFTGKTVVVDASAYPNCIPAKVIQSVNLEDNLDFVLFHTGWSQNWNTESYFGDFPYLEEEAAAYLTGLNLKGVGFDTPSADALHSTALKNHHLFFEAGMVILENLTNLDKLVGQHFELFCFPLNIKNGDGSPVRAVALIRES